jgi:hypothetical protein
MEARVVFVKSTSNSMGMRHLYCKNNFPMLGNFY